MSTAARNSRLKEHQEMEEGSGGMRQQQRQTVKPEAALCQGGSDTRPRRQQRTCRDDSGSTQEAEAAGVLQSSPIRSSYTHQNEARWRRRGARWRATRWRRRERAAAAKGGVVDKIGRTGGRKGERWGTRKERRGTRSGASRSASLRRMHSSLRKPVPSTRQHQWRVTIEFLLFLAFFSLN